MEALLDTGMLLRWAHLSAGFVWVGLLWFLSGIDGPLLAGLDPAARRVVLPRLLPRALWLLRWGAALTWLGGVWYGFGYLALQDTEGTLHWLTVNERGRWIGLGFVYGTLMVFNVWFVIWPRWQLLLRAMAAGEWPEDAERWARTAVLHLRFNVYLSLPLLYAMAAGKHAGELGHDRGAFGPNAIAVTALGMAFAALLLHGVLPLVGRTFREAR